MENALPFNAEDFQTDLIELALQAPAGSRTRRTALEAARLINKELDCPAIGELPEALGAALSILDAATPKTIILRDTALTIARAIDLISVGSGSRSEV